MRRFPVVVVLAALLPAIFFLCLLTGCGGSSKPGTPSVARIALTPTTISLNEGGVATLTATAYNSNGAPIAADITFTSSNSNIATVSSGGLVCGGVWDSSTINCNPTIGQGGVGQVTITATSGTATATATAYVHLQVDRVVANPPSGCTSMGQAVPVTASVYSTSAPGCSPSAPCDITSTVGPIAFASNNLTVAANSAGIEPTFNSGTKSPSYSSGGTITGSKGQTCNLSNFGVGGSSGIDPIFDPATNSPTYTSGGAITGSAGQFCNLSNFNGVTGATATVTLTATNTIVSGAHLTITASGSGATTPPTTAMLSSGSATCSGTATVVTALIGVGGGSSQVVGAMANVTLTGTNTIASGTPLTVTASGYGATTPPTTATLTNGTATCSGTANVITSLTGNSTFTAENPGSTTIFGSVSGVNSVSVPYLTCPAVSIMVHDASSSNTSFTLGKGGTQPLTADVYDSAGQYIKPALTWSSSSLASATVAAGATGNNLATITGVNPGSATITASCSYPNCNASFPGAQKPYNVAAQYSQNVVTVGISGTTAANVYAASTHSTSVVPISTSANTVGTAITLPNLPNSILVDSTGNNLYLGSSSGVMVVNLSTNAITTSPLAGSVVAISPDGKYLVVSDSVGKNVYYFSLTDGSLAYTAGGITTSSAAYAADSKFTAWVSGTELTSGLQTGVQLGLPGNGMTMLGYTANGVDFLAEGGLFYITGSNPGGIEVRSTCDQSVVQTIAAGSPTLIKQIPNGVGLVATDSPSVDVVSTSAVLSAGCPVTTLSTLGSVDMGVGAFQAQQLFVSPDSTHAWIISDQPELMYLDLQGFAAVVIPYTGGAFAYSGGITLDSAQVYVGTTDGTVHRIAVASNADVQQIQVNLKDSSGNLVAPDLVVVQPH